MKIPALVLALVTAPFAVSASSPGQTANLNQSVTLEGLRSSAGHGNFLAVKHASDGSLFFLFDQQDGIRLVKTDSSGSMVLAEAHIGGKGDDGVAMTLDLAGNLYVVGTTRSGSLAGTAGAVFPQASDTSTNSFLARFDTELNPVFLTFLGAGRTAATGVAVTGDAVFVTGVTFNPAFPVTSAAIQKAPSQDSTENGFVERFSMDGSTLAYATYLTGTGGDTAPSAIVADHGDNAYITGSNSASGYPTMAALQMSFLCVEGVTRSGFLTKLAPDGSAFVFSTFIAGSGITGLALDAATSSLALTGNVSSGQFPVAAVSMPLTSTAYQTLLRISLDGQTVKSSRVLVPGSQSFVTTDADGGAWISGALAVPLFPENAVPSYVAGDSFLLHVDAEGNIDQTLRFGGNAVNHPADGSLTSTVGPPESYDTHVALPGSLTAALDTSTMPQRFDLPTAATPSTILPNVLQDLAPAAAACGTSGQCSGTGGFLALVDSASAQATLSLSSDDLPNLTLRNLGSTSAAGLTISSTGFTVTNDCGPTLEASAQCSLALTGAGPGSLSIKASNATSVTLNVPSITSAPDAIVLDANELDYGVVTSNDPAVSRVIVVTNLTGTTQTFNSAQDGEPADAPFTLAEIATTCNEGGSPGVHSIPANSSCKISIGLAASSAIASDVPVRAFWKIGNRDIVVTGYVQVAALNLSSSAINFGVLTAGSAVHSPRYLYLSNNSTTALPHTVASVPAGSPFTVTDACPSMLGSHTVCRITVTYFSSSAPSADSTTMAVDGVAVLLTATTLPASSPSNSPNSALTVSATSVIFSTPTIVTQVSSSAQLLTIGNAGTTPLSVAFALTGDFTAVSDCPASLAANAACVVQITFAPSQPGERDGLLSLTSGSGFTPTYVSLTGTGLPLLPANNGTLAIGTTLLGEPVVAWYKIQQPLSSLTATTNSALFGVALVADTGSGHGSLPASEFHESVTANCNNCWLGVQFFSQTAGAASASLTLASNGAGSSYVVALTGTALPVQGLLLTPGTQDFGSVEVGSSSAPATFSLANLLTPASDVTIQSVAVSGDFTVVTNSNGGAACSGSLSPTASCFIQVAFAPGTTGAREGTLTVVTAAGSVTAALTGAGLQASGFSIDPTALTFANVPGSAATQQSINLSNTGTQTLTVGSVTSSDASFSVTSNCATLAAGAACAVNVTFVPQVATVMGTLSIPVTFSSNSHTATYSVALVGAYTLQGSGMEIVENNVNFGSTGSGGIGQTRQFTLNNLTGKPLNVTFDLPREFPLASAAPCAALSAGGTCSFSVSFVPVTGGPLTGTILARGAPTDGSATVQALAYTLGYGASTRSLTVTGIPIPNTPLNFGQVTSGSQSQLVLTLSNSGTENLTIRRITSQPPFDSTTTCGTPLPPNASCSVRVTYLPVYEVMASAGATPRIDTGSITIESDAITSPDTLSLTGTVLPVVSTNPTTSAVLSSLSFSQGALTFANTQVGDVSAVQTVTATNAGTTTLHISSWTVSTDFSVASTCATLLPGSACDFNVSFTPTAASTAPVRSGALEVLSDAGTSLDFVSLLGSSTPAALTLNPSALDFGTVNVGGSDALNVTVTNISTMPVTFGGLSTTGDYTVAGGGCPADGASLAAGATCVLTVHFAPSAIGTQDGTLSLSNGSAQLPLTVSLTGVAVTGHLQATPGALAFGNIDDGSPALLTVTLLNTGNASITGMGNTLTGPNAEDFAVTAPCSVTTLAPNQGCTETITFTPSAVGARTATLSIPSSDPNGPLAIALSGTGVPAGSFVLTVNGQSAASVTVSSGSPAIYSLLLTPKNDFTGQVALTCAPITAGEYASCSLLSSSLQLGSSPLSSTATINTITSEVGATVVAFAGLLVLPFARRRNATRRRFLSSSWVALILLAVLTVANGCGGGGEPTVSNVKTTPPGTYKYEVTASSTSGAAVASTVTLNLVVQ